MQWDTSEHDWLEGRGGKLYLIAMIDDAGSELQARFVRHDSSEENLAELLEAMKFRDLLLCLAKSGRVRERLCDRFASHPSGQSELGIVASVVGFGAVASRLTAAPHDGGNGTGPKIA